MNVIDLRTDYNDTINAANREAQEKRCSIFLHFSCTLMLFRFLAFPLAQKSLIIWLFYSSSFQQCELFSSTACNLQRLLLYGWTCSCVCVGALGGWLTSSCTILYFMIRNKISHWTASHLGWPANELQNPPVSASTLALRFWSRLCITFDMCVNFLALLTISQLAPPVNMFTSWAFGECSLAEKTEKAEIKEILKDNPSTLSFQG